MSEFSKKIELQDHVDASFLRRLMAGLLIATAICGAGIAGTIPLNEDGVAVVAAIE